MYVKLRRALYGTIQAAMLFWKNLTKVLKSWGFKINPYDWCVANKNVNGKQLTVVWHVDDLKISHVDKNVVLALIEKLNNKYGNTASGQDVPLTVHRGKLHYYLGMTLDYRTKNKVRIDMRAYIKKVLKELDELTNGWTGNAVTPAAEHLYQTRNEAKRLSIKESEHFHHVVAQLLFLCKRGRPDIQTAIAFLTTRVKSPDEDDGQKLRRVIKYLRGTQNLVLTLESDNTLIVTW